jgi:hypothetical protein
MMKTRSGAVVVFAILLCLACGGWGRRVRMGERFTLHPGDRVVVAGAGLSLRLEEVGHRFYADGRGDDPFATLSARTGGAPWRTVTVGDRVAVGGSTLRLVAANPFERDGGPSATFVVTRR